MRINNFKNSHRGFSLLEMSIVMGISGFLMVTGMQMYKIYIKGLKKVETYETMNKIDNAIGTFYAGQKRYPCPADPALPISDPNAGVENCNLGAPVVAMGACNTGGGFCNVGGRDADKDTFPDSVLIGAIPYKTMKLARDDLNPYDTATDGTSLTRDDKKACNEAYTAAFNAAGGGTAGETAGAAAATALTTLTGLARTLCPGFMKKTLEHESSILDVGAESSLDAWGNQLTYAVTTRLTSNAMGVFDITLGAITVQTEALVPKQLTEPKGSAMWALVSHGQDGNGAFRADGVRRACGTVSKDIANCNDDSIFINGVLSMGSDPNDYFDDMTYYSASRLSSLWTNAQDDAGGDGSDSEKDIINRNTGNVGIGLAQGASVDERLELANALRAQSVMSTRVCDSTTAKCFHQENFGGPTGVKCPDLIPPDSLKYIMVVTSVENDGVHCEKLELKKFGAKQECAAGEAVRGIDSLGKIICVTLP
jgi:prepilin-type N-terminal cleavage/methylation domain-containing protein